MPSVTVATATIRFESFVQTRLASSMRAATGCWCTVDATIKVERSTSRGAKLRQHVTGELPAQFTASHLSKQLHANRRCHMFKATLSMGFTLSCTTFRQPALRDLESCLGIL